MKSCSLTTSTTCGVNRTQQEAPQSRSTDYCRKEHVTKTWNCSFNVSAATNRPERKVKQSGRGLLTRPTTDTQTQSGDINKRGRTFPDIQVYLYICDNKETGIKHVKHRKPLPRGDVYVQNSSVFVFGVSRSYVTVYKKSLHSFMCEREQARS